MAYYGEPVPVPVPEQRARQEWKEAHEVPDMRSTWYPAPDPHDRIWHPAAVPPTDMPVAGMSGPMSCTNMAGELLHLIHKADIVLDGVFGAERILKEPSTMPVDQRGLVELLREAIDAANRLNDRVDLLAVVVGKL